MSPTRGEIGNGRSFTLLERAGRLLRYRFQIPLKRSRHSPEHTARGVAVGTAWAMTPIFGAQMAAVLITWVIARKFFKWDFSLINGLAWTWTTNVFTLLPSFYVFYVTGQVMMGQFENLGGQETFDKLSAIVNDPKLTGIEAASDWIATIASDWGLPLCIGWVPWSALSAWAAYRLSLNFVIAYRKRRTGRINGVRS